MPFFMQGVGSQVWDIVFTVQALLASNLTNEIGPTLARRHDFIKKSQVSFSILKASLHRNHQISFFFFFFFFKK
jgi:squalene cyclase